MIRFFSFQIFSCLKALYIAVSTGKPTFFLVRIMWSFTPHLLAGLLRIPVFLEINDSPFRTYAMIISPLKRRMIRRIDKLSYALSDHLFPVTRKIADDLNRMKGIPVAKMTVMPSGTNTDLFRPLDRKACCNTLGMSEDRLYIGFIGTFFRYQGIDTLIDCAPDIISRIENVRFLLVGDGPMRSRWENMIHASSLDKHFILPGFVPYESVPIYCGVMDICVAPLNSEAGESSAVKIFDYLACEKPVVMSNIQGTGKAFQNSGAVLLVPPEDPHALAEALTCLVADKA